jgi:hypothetical protein
MNMDYELDNGTGAIVCDNDTFIAAGGHGAILQCNRLSKDQSK